MIFVVQKSNLILIRLY